jgi:hypothetical protein
MMPAADKNARVLWLKAQLTHGPVRRLQLRSAPVNQPAGQHSTPGVTKLYISLGQAVERRSTGKADSWAGSKGPPPMQMLQCQLTPAQDKAHTHTTHFAVSGLPDASRRRSKMAKFAIML